MREVVFDGTFEGWRRVARTEILNETRPEALIWTDNSKAPPSLALFENVERPPFAEERTLRVPPKFIHLAKVVARHSSGDQWPLLYRVLWQLHNGQGNLLDNPAHQDVLTLERLEKDVLKDAYRIVAFVRFREIRTSGGTWYVAWIEPEHDSLPLAAEHFVKRYANMQWSILTPARCAHWDLHRLDFTAGVDSIHKPGEDEMESLWLTYYSRIFNPARVNPKAMQAQMPMKTWRNLPEAEAIRPALAQARGRVTQMIKDSRAKSSPVSVAPTEIPETRDIARLHEAAKRCRRCPLYARATCVVFGAGSPRSKVMLVGEQPGNDEDLAGAPFVGPAGKMLDRALEAANVDRAAVYVTNAVKHFKWVQKGKRRMHDTPNTQEIAACRPWLEAEIESVKPRLIVCLGSTAAQSVLGHKVKILENRGKILQEDHERGVTRDLPILITIHPSMLLRVPSRDEAAVQFERFASDLAKIKQYLS